MQERLKVQRKHRSLNFPLQVSSCRSLPRQFFLGVHSSQSTRGGTDGRGQVFSQYFPLGQCPTHHTHFGKYCWAPSRGIFTNIEPTATSGKCSGCRTLTKITRQESDQNIERKSFKRHYWTSVTNYILSQELEIRHKCTLHRTLRNSQSSNVCV